MAAGAPTVLPPSLDRVIHDLHYRTAALQIVALLAVMLIGAGLTANLLAGLSARGIGFGFGFLGAEAGQPGAPAPSRGGTVLAGLARTVALTGAAALAALLLGTAATGLRLSRNWLAGRVAGVFCAVLGEAPVLVWMLMLAAGFAVLGETGAVLPLFGGIALADGAGLHLPQLRLGADAGVVAGVALLSAVTASALAMRSRRERRRTGDAPSIAWTVPAILLGPAAAANLWLDDAITVASAAPGAGLTLRPALAAVLTGLSLHGAARVATTLCAAWRSVAAEQRIAARALGLSDTQAALLVIGPQAARLAVPDLLRDGFGILRNATLAIAVGYVELTGVLGDSVIAATGRDLESLLLLFGFYLLAGWLIARLAVGARRALATGST